MRLETVSNYALVCLLLLVVIVMPGCAAIAGIFKAGMWVGVIMAVVIIGGIMLVVSRFR
jgi:hypothetical protein